MVFSTMLAFPLAGFLFGYINSQGGVPNKIIGGLIFSVLTPLSGGHPPRNAGGVGEPLDAWPYITPIWITSFVIVGVTIFGRQVMLARRNSKFYCPDSADDKIEGDC
jgi:hypothetical protein